MADQQTPVVVRAVPPAAADRLVGVGVALAVVALLVAAPPVPGVFWVVLVAIALPFPGWRRPLARLVRRPLSRLIVDRDTLTVVNWWGRRRTVAASTIRAVGRHKVEDSGFFDWRSVPDVSLFTIVRLGDGRPSWWLPEDTWTSLEPIWRELGVTPLPASEHLDEEDLHRLARSWAPFRDRHPLLVQVVGWHVWLVGALLAIGLVVDAART